MNTAHAVRAGLGLLTVTLVVVASVSGQVPSNSTQDPVLAEIRALRADLNQRLEASIRAQLLVARLQLQEQRINGVVQQLRQVEDSLRDNEHTRASIEGGLKMFGADKPGTAAAGKEGMDFLIGPLRAHLEKLAQSDGALKARQADLMTQLGQEQARWTAFNSLLDELEAMLTKVRR